MTSFAQTFAMPGQPAEALQAWLAQHTKSLDRQGFVLTDQTATSLTYSRKARTNPLAIVVGAIFVIVGLAGIGGGSTAFGIAAIVLAVPFLFVKEGRVQGPQRGGMTVRFEAAGEGTRVTAIGNGPPGFVAQVQRVGEGYTALTTGAGQPSLLEP